MSLRADTTQLISGSLVASLYPGLGIRGDAVPSTGTHGPGLLFNDISLPSEAADEFMCRVLSAPAGSLTLYEDSSFEYTGAGGSGTYEGFKNGVSYGTAAFTINIGVAPTINTQPAAQSVNDGSVANFSVVASGTAPLSYQWRFNGTPIGGATSSTYARTSVLADTGGLVSVVVTNALGSVTSSNATLTVNALGVAPTINTQPAAQTVTEGAVANFSVVASGTAPLSYQWRFNGTNVSGATSSAYARTAVIGDNGGLVSVVVTNSSGTVTSANAALTVNSAAGAPAIVTQPQSQVAADGAVANFSVVASGTAPLSYQWRFNGANISGATSSAYARTAALADNGGLVSVVVSNAFGGVTSANAALTVTGAAVAPAIVTQPQARTVTEGATATFNVSASGTAPLSYQWRFNGSPISGATSSSYTRTTVLGDNAGLVSVVVTNSAGSATSSGALLTVNATPAPGTRVADVTFTIKRGAWRRFLYRMDKQPREVKDIVIDLAPWFLGRADDPVSVAFDASSVEITPTVELVGMRILIAIAGGISGRSYNISVRMTTNAIPAIVREFDIRVLVGEVA